MAKRGPKYWTPEKSCLARHLTIDELLRKVDVARGEGLQALDEIASNELYIHVDTLMEYLKRKPNSELSRVLTRARMRRTAFMKGKASAIAVKDDHPRQADMLKFLLGKLGGDEFKDKVVLAGEAGAPVTAVVEFIPRQGPAPRKKKRT